MAKLAVPTDDGKTISPNFGRAEQYLVYDIQENVIREKETRPKAHMAHTGMQKHENRGSNLHPPPGMAALHERMLSGIADCQVLIARGIGRPMYEAIIRSGMKVFVTQTVLADEAVKAYIGGTLDNHVEQSTSKDILDLNP